MLNQRVQQLEKDLKKKDKQLMQSSQKLTALEQAQQNQMSESATKMRDSIGAGLTMKLKNANVEN